MGGLTGLQKWQMLWEGSHSPPKTKIWSAFPSKSFCWDHRVVVCMASAPSVCFCENLWHWLLQAKMWWCFFNSVSWRFHPVAWTSNCPLHGYPPPLWRSHSVEWPHHATTAGSLPHTDLTSQRRNLANLQGQYNQLELSALAWLSISLLTFMSPHTTLSWNTLSLCSLGTRTLMDLRNLRYFAVFIPTRTKFGTWCWTFFVWNCWSLHADSLNQFFFHGFWWPF